MDGSSILVVALLLLVCPVAMWLMMRGDHNSRPRGGDSDLARHRMQHERPRDSGSR